MKNYIEMNNIGELEKSINAYNEDTKSIIRSIQNDTKSYIRTLNKYSESYVRRDISILEGKLSKLNSIVGQFSDVCNTRVIALSKAKSIYEQSEMDIQNIISSNIRDNFRDLLKTVKNTLHNFITIDKEKWKDSQNLELIDEKISDYFARKNMPYNPYKNKAVVESFELLILSMKDAGIDLSDKEIELIGKMREEEIRLLVQWKEQLIGKDNIGEKLMISILISALYNTYHEEVIEQSIGALEVTVTMDGIDYERLNPSTQKRIQFLVHAILTMEDGEEWVDDKFAAITYTREDYEAELDRLIKLLEDPLYSSIDKATGVIYRSGEGVLQMVGGAGEVAAGWGIATLGSWMVVTVPVGGYLIIDGGSNFVEGFGKTINGVSNPGAEAINPLRDYVYEKVLGEDLGERVYNFTSIAAGIICIGKSLMDLKKLGLIKTFSRKKNITKAKELGLPVEKVVHDFGDSMMIVVQVVDPKTSTPMILEKVVINIKEITNQGAGIALTMDGTYDMIQKELEDGDSNE